jgi:hypothetical protein
VTVKRGRRSVFTNTAQPMAHAHAVMIPSVPEAEWDSDDRVPPMVRPIGPGAEIARRADWSVTVGRTQDGFCVSHAHSDGGSGFAHGRLPGPGSRSKHVVVIVGTPARQKEGVGFIAGLVIPNVARVQVQLRDGTVISAQTEAAPDALEVDLRTFVMTTPFDEQPVGPGFSPRVHEYVLFESDDTVLERLTLWPRNGYT